MHALHCMSLKKEQGPKRVGLANSHSQHQHHACVSLRASACFALRVAGAVVRYDVPLVADIHFQPAVAMMVAEAFEKVGGSENRLLGWWLVGWLS